MPKTLVVGLSFVCASLANLTAAQDHIYHKGADYELPRVERTSTYPGDLLPSDLDKAPPAPARGQEFAIVRFKTTPDRAFESPQPADARLLANDVTYRCHQTRTWCGGEGCGAAFVFYIPQESNVERFEMAGVAVQLSAAPIR